MPTVEDLPTLHITGTEVNYYVLCPRKLWWFTHDMDQEHVDSGVGSENVALGQLLHQESYPRVPRKDILIDNLLRLDFTEDGKVHEIKKSRGGEKAAHAQLLYYLYYLKYVKRIETTGEIDYPQQRRTEKVTLTQESEAEVERILAGVIAIRALTGPPPVEKPMALCAKCAYEELCWG